MLYPFLLFRDFIPLVNHYSLLNTNFIFLAHQSVLKQFMEQDGAKVFLHKSTLNTERK